MARHSTDPINLALNIEPNDQDETLTAIVVRGTAGVGAEEIAYIRVDPYNDREDRRVRLVGLEGTNGLLGVISPFLRYAAELAIVADFVRQLHFMFRYANGIDGPHTSKIRAAWTLANKNPGEL